MAADKASALSPERMRTQSLRTLLPVLIAPAFVAQLVNALYSIVDRIFIARIPGEGTQALAGIGICFPITIAISAFAQLIGNGGAPLAAIALGRKDTRRAETILGTAVASLLTISFVLTVVFEIWKDPILLLFGASKNTLPYGSAYLGAYVWGTAAVELSLGLNPFISAQGRSAAAMVSSLVGAAANLLLDPLFIFGFGWGIRGAAVASVTGQFLSAVWILVFLSSHRSGLRLRLRRIGFSPVLGRVLALGAAPFTMQLTECLINIVFNTGLRSYGGDDWVAAMTVVSSCMQFFYVFSNSINQGAQPVISYCYGAGDIPRVRKVSSTVFRLYVGVYWVVVILMAVFPSLFADIFSPAPAVRRVVIRMLPLFVCGWLVFGLQSGAQTVFVGLGLAKRSLFLAVLRKVILLIPLALILPHFLGAVGIFAAEPISDTLSGLTAGAMYLSVRKNYLSGERSQVQEG